MVKPFIEQCAIIVLKVEEQALLYGQELVIRKKAPVKSVGFKANT